MSTSETNKEIIRSFVKAINEGNWDSLESLVSPDFVRHSHAAGEPVRNREELISFLRAESETFPDGREELLDLVVEGNKVAARQHFRGTQQGPMGPYSPTGKVLSADYIAIYRIEDGRIKEAWVEWDNQTGLEQLGHI